MTEKEENRVARELKKLWDGGKPIKEINPFKIMFEDQYKCKLEFVDYEDVVL